MAAGWTQTSHVFRRRGFTFRVTQRHNPCCSVILTLHREALHTTPAKDQPASPSETPAELANTLRLALQWTSAKCHVRSFLPTPANRHLIRISPACGRDRAAQRPPHHGLRHTHSFLGFFDFFFCFASCARLIMTPSLAASAYRARAQSFSPPTPLRATAALPSPRKDPPRAHRPRFRSRSRARAPLQIRAWPPRAAGPRRRASG